MWRFKNPRARARAPAGHPALDLLHPLFLALVDLEQSMLTSDLLGHEDLALLDRVQQVRGAYCIDPMCNRIYENVVACLAPTGMFYLTTIFDIVF